MDGSLNVATQVSEVVDRLARIAKQKNVFLLLDGFDSYDRDRIKGTQTLFKTKLATMSRVKVVCIGGEDVQEERFPRGNHSLSSPDHTEVVRLKYIRIGNCEKLVQAYAKVIKAISVVAERRKTLNADQILVRLRSSDIRLIDLLKLDIVERSNDDAWDRDRHRFRFTLAIHQYLQQKIGEELRTSNELPNNKTMHEMVTSILSRASRYVYFRDFNLEYSSLEPGEELFTGPCWGLLTAPAAIRSFLRAYYIISTLQEAGRVEDSKESIRMWKGSGLPGRIFPEDVNGHCKVLLNNGLTRDTAILAYTTLQRICDSYLENFRDGERKRTAPVEFADHLSKHIVFTHSCYLLGRLTTPEQKQARGLLERLYKYYVETMTWIDDPQSARSPDITEACAKIRMIQCTVIVSLIHVTPVRRHQVEFVESFAKRLEHDEWRDLCCGFHLQYYGDQPFDSDVVNHVPGSNDLGGAFPRTVEAIVPRIETAVRAWDLYPSFDVEMLVLCTLALRRKCNRDFHSKPGQDWCLSEVLRVCSLTDHEFEEPLASVLALTRMVLSQQNSVMPQSFVGKMLELKYDTPRTGPIAVLGIEAEACIKAKRPGQMMTSTESVAAHTWSAMMLAEVLLPEHYDTPNGDDQYDKGRVIRSLLIHDLPECVSGDKPLTATIHAVAHTAEDQRAENSWASFFAKLGILDGFCSTFSLETRWEDVEEHRSVNGKIALAMDKLDTLITLVIYKRKFESVYDSKKDVWDTFFSGAKGQFKTSANRHEITRDLITPWLEWADSEWNEKGSRMSHDQLFAGTFKFYLEAKEPIER